MTGFVDFKEVKARVSIVQVLGRYSVSPRKVNSSYVRGDCPLPQHGQGSKGTFGANTDKNIWSCQSGTCTEARGGRKGGNVLDFVSWMERCSIKEAAEKLAEWFLVSNSPAKPEIVEGFNRPLAFQLRDIQHVHPYLLKRGFEEEECEYMGVGFFPGKGSMENRIVFPIRNAKGELVAYAGRSIDDAEPLWKFPMGFQRGLELWNLHEVLADAWTEIVVVESFWGVLACIRAGVMNSVALMSNNATDEQVKVLSSFPAVTLMLDGDKWGREGTERLVLKLRDLTAVSVVNLDTDVQPDDLPVDYLRAALRLREMEPAQLYLLQPA